MTGSGARVGGFDLVDLPGELFDEESAWAEVMAELGVDCDKEWERLCQDPKFTSWIDSLGAGEPDVFADLEDGMVA